MFASICSSVSGGRIALRPVGSPMRAVKSPMRSVDVVTGIDELLQLAQHDGVPDMQIRARRIESRA